MINWENWMILMGLIRNLLSEYFRYVFITFI